MSAPFRYSMRCKTCCEKKWRSAFRTGRAFSRECRTCREWRRLDDALKQRERYAKQRYNVWAYRLQKLRRERRQFDFRRQRALVAIQTQDVA